MGPLAGEGRALRVRRLAALVALAAGATVFALVLAELAVRAFAGGWIFYAEPRLESGPHAYLPGQSVRFAHPEWDVEIRTNAHGFRDEEACPRRGPADVVMLGDSFVEAYGVALERSVSKELEALLARRPAAGTVREAIPGPPAPGTGREAVAGPHVYNAGRHGTQPAQYIGTWNACFARVPHAAVLMGVYVGNDVVEPGAPDRLEPPDRTTLGYRARAFFSERCALYNFVRYHVRRSPPLFWLMGRLGLMTFIPALPEPAVHDRRWSPERVAHTARLLGAFGQRLAAAGKRFGVFLIPTREQAEEPRWRDLVARGLIDPGKDERFGLNEVLAAALAREGVRVVDLGPGLAKASAAGARNYFVVDRHWSPEGHRNAAVILRSEFFPR